MTSEGQLEVETLGEKSHMLLCSEKKPNDGFVEPLCVRRFTAVVS